jgi:hypothetical protein
MGETMDSAEVIEQLKERHDFERGARWATEDFFAWVVAFETGLLVNAGWHHWWLSVIAGIATIFAFARYSVAVKKRPKKRTTAQPNSVDTLHEEQNSREQDSALPRKAGGVSERVQMGWLQ